MLDIIYKLTMINNLVDRRPFYLNALCQFPRSICFGCGQTGMSVLPDIGSSKHIDARLATSKNPIFIAFTQSVLALSKEEVKFNNGDITLTGTLYLLKGEGPFPAIVFLHGSGSETRKNSSYSAKWMTSIGYAALIYDKRGTGESDGDNKSWSRFSFEDLTGDVIAVVNFLSEKERIDKTKIGLHASSQGAWVVTLTATKTSLISFMIIRSPSVATVGEDRIFERTARLKREGFSTSDIAEAREMQMMEAKTSSGDDTPDDFTRLFEQNKNKSWFPRVYRAKDPFDKFWLITECGTLPL